MTPQQQEHFDTALLRVLDANKTRFGLGVPALGHLLGQYGFPNPTTDDLKDRVDYLEHKGLVEEALKAIHTANRAWRITDAGINHLDNHG
jgi:hypothetical protein